MKIKQEKTFEPVTIILETREEYLELIAIVDEASGVPHDDREYMSEAAGKLAVELSNYFSGNL